MSGGAINRFGQRVSWGLRILIAHVHNSSSLYIVSITTYWPKQPFGTYICFASLLYCSSFRMHSQRKAVIFRFYLFFGLVWFWMRRKNRRKKTIIYERELAEYSGGISAAQLHVKKQSTHIVPNRHCHRGQSSVMDGPENTVRCFGKITRRS